MVRWEVLSAAGWRCQVVLDSGEVCLRPGKLQVDHIKPLATGGEPYEKSNLRATCERCHWAKTALENETPNPERDEWRAYLRDML